VLCVTLLSTSVFIGPLKQLPFITFHLKRFLWAEFISYVREPLASVMWGKLYSSFGWLVESKFRMSTFVYLKRKEFLILKHTFYIRVRYYGMKSLDSLIIIDCNYKLLTLKFLYYFRCRQDTVIFYPLFKPQTHDFHCKTDFNFTLPHLLYQK
jgi:hypothetical protein